MNGTLAQAITLTAHGNAYLSRPDAEPPDLSANSTFQYVEALQFARSQTREDKEGLMIATMTSDWFRWLKTNGIKRLWHIAFAWDRTDFPEHMLIHFVDQIPRAIQADLPDGTFDLWYAKWTATAHKPKPWLVEYCALRSDQDHAMRSIDLPEVKETLRRNLVAAERFARLPGVDGDIWADTFASARSLLILPLRSRRTIRTCCHPKAITWNPARFSPQPRKPTSLAEWVVLLRR